MAKKRPSKKTEPDIGWDHPIVAAGFIPEHLLLAVWGFSDSYWPKWLTENSVPHWVFHGKRWFHMTQLAEWFRSESGTGGKFIRDLFISADQLASEFHAADARPILAFAKEHGIQSVRINKREYYLKKQWLHAMLKAVGEAEPESSS